MRSIWGVLLVLLLSACATVSHNGAASYQDVDDFSDLAHLQQAAPDKQKDLWQVIRSGFAMPDLQTRLVTRQTNWYVQHPDYIERMMGRAEKYLYHIVKEVNARHLPMELALLPFIESAYNPQASSTAKAVGIWQFIPGTGKEYNLKQNVWRDDRRDVLASTDAALDYLSTLYQQFGDWHLALAAYNWGAGNVQKAINRNRARRLKTDYLHLRMPNETRNYAPKLQAIKNIVLNPEKYHIKLPPMPDHPYFAVVTIDHDLDVDLAARFAGLSITEFRALNPSFSKPVILSATDPQILLPFDSADIFQQNMSDYNGVFSSWTAYTLSKTSTPQQIARKLDISLQELIRINRIPKGMSLKIGSTIVVPRSDEDDEDISAEVADNAKIYLTRSLPYTRRMVIRVRRSQSLSTIASHYGVRVSDIKRWNKLKGTVIYPKQVLVLHVPKGRVVPAEPNAHYHGSGRLVVRVRQNQTLSHLARRYGVSVRRIQQWNRLKGTLIHPGQVLVLYPRRG